MTERKFHRRIYVVEILSEDPIPAGVDLKAAMEEAQDGAYSGHVLSESDDELNGRQAAALLTIQGSGPEFFQLTPGGDDSE